MRLLLKSGADPNLKEQDYEGNSPLLAALKAENDEIFQMLLAAGSDIDASNNWGQTALHMAVYTANTVAVRKLLEMKADVNQKDEEGQTVFDYARTFAEKFPENSEIKEIVQLLYDAGT